MTVKTDLLLAHAPAFFDFRNRSDIYFPYLSTSGDVPITPLYEYFPLGFKTLQRFLGDAGFDVKIVNIATVLLKCRELDIEDFLEGIDARVIGIDLHWMVHVQGSLAIASLFKQLQPETPVLFGGISSTYYAQELIRRPEVDMVMRGYDTHAPTAALMGALGDARKLERVPNLLWKSRDGEIHDNGFGHTPATFSCGIDWSSLPAQNPDAGLPALEGAIEQARTPEQSYKTLTGLKTPIKPQTNTQAKYLDLLTGTKNDLIFGVGPAGTGKTFLAVAAGSLVLHVDGVRSQGVLVADIAASAEQTSEAA